MEEVEWKLEISFRYNKENNSEILSEAFSRSDRFTELDGPSIPFCRADVVDLTQNVTSIDFRYLRGFLFLATVLVRGHGIGKRGEPTPDGAGV